MACIDGNYVPYRLCKAAGIEPGGYYHYVKRLTKHTIEKCNNQKIISDINFLQIKHKQTLGYRQITMQLNRFYKKVGVTKVNSKRVLRLMRENNLLAIIRTTNASAKMRKATSEDKTSPNILQRDFSTGAALQKIFTDISYLRSKFGFVYLSAAKDSVTREIVAYNVKDNLGLELSLDILNDLSKLKLADEAMVHSDQGVHYTAKRYRQLMDEFKLIQSMSRRGNC